MPQKDSSSNILWINDLLLLKGGKLPRKPINEFRAQDANKGFINIQRRIIPTTNI